MSFIQTDIKQLNENMIGMISKDWMLLSAGTPEGYNEMTVSWGGLGFLWNEPVATVYVRPQRYTDQFLKNNNTFSLCVFDEQYRDMLRKAGAISGKDCNKTAQLGLSPIFEDGTVYFEQARLVFICEKLYTDKFLPQNFEKPETLEKYYPEKDYHNIYIGAIKKVFYKT